MHPAETAAAEISANATAADVDAAHAYMAVRNRDGHAAAMASPGAVHLAATYQINRCLGFIARRIADDHPRPEMPYDARHRRSRERLIARWRAGGLTDADLNARLDRIAAHRAEEEFRWRVLEARDRYRALSPAERVRDRLAFRAARPRRPLRSL